MKELKQKLSDLIKLIETTLEAEIWQTDVLIDTRNKLILYIKKYFTDNTEYIQLVNDISSEPKSFSSYKNCLVQLKSIIIMLLEDIQLSETDVNVIIENEKQEIISQAIKEMETEREKIQIEANEIQKIKEDLQRKTESLLNEEEKLNSFKTKLEFADKGVDFQFDAKQNKESARLWAIATILLMIILFIIVYCNLESNLSFSKIAKEIKNDFLLQKKPFSDNLIINTIYITYAKLIFTRLLFYSLIIFCIKFTVRNYNAQMHNYIINSHKSNSLKSTLSLLDTAKSEDGNDKLLVQASQAIFSHQNTGFNNKETESNSPNLITNVIDNVSKKLQ